jgi:hypothetical protein
LIERDPSPASFASLPRDPLPQGERVTERVAPIRTVFIELRLQPYRPVRASELTQPTMRDLTFSISFFVKKSSGFTRSIG